MAVVQPQFYPFRHCCVDTFSSFVKVYIHVWNIIAFLNGILRVIIFLC